MQSGNLMNDELRWWYVATGDYKRYLNLKIIKNTRIYYRYMRVP